MPAWMQPHGDDTLLDVTVAPGATRTRVMAVAESRLKIQINAPDDPSQTNAALIRFLADTLLVSRAQVEVVGGPVSRRKTVRLMHVPAHVVLLRLSPHENR